MINEPQRLDPAQPCAACGKPAIKAYGGEPLCTMCHTARYLAQAAHVRASAPPFRENAEAPVWEPGERV